MSLKRKSRASRVAANQRVALSLPIGTAGSSLEYVRRLSDEFDGSEVFDYRRVEITNRFDPTSNVPSQTIRASTTTADMLDRLKTVLHREDLILLAKNNPDDTNLKVLKNDDLLYSLGRSAVFLVGLQAPTAMTIYSRNDHSKMWQIKIGETTQTSDVLKAVALAENEANHRVFALEFESIRSALKKKSSTAVKTLELNAYVIDSVRAVEAGAVFRLVINRREVLRTKSGGLVLKTPGRRPSSNLVSELATSPPANSTLALIEKKRPSVTNPLAKTTAAVIGTPSISSATAISEEISNPKEPKAVRVLGLDKTKDVDEQSKPKSFQDEQRIKRRRVESIREHCELRSVAARLSNGAQTHVFKVIVQGLRFSDIAGSEHANLLGFSDGPQPETEAILRPTAVPHRVLSSSPPQIPRLQQRRRSAHPQLEGRIAEWLNSRTVGGASRSTDNVFAHNGASTSHSDDEFRSAEASGVGETSSTIEQTSESEDNSASMSGGQLQLNLAKHAHLAYASSSPTAPRPLNKLSASGHNDMASFSDSPMAPTVSSSEITSTQQPLSSSNGSNSNKRAEFFEPLTLHVEMAPNDDVTNLVWTIGYALKMPNWSHWALFDGKARAPDFLQTHALLKLGDPDRPFYLRSLNRITEAGVVVNISAGAKISDSLRSRPGSKHQTLVSEMAEFRMLVTDLTNELDTALEANATAEATASRLLIANEKLRARQEVLLAGIKQLTAMVSGNVQKKDSGDSKRATVPFDVLSDPMSWPLNFRRDSVASVGVMVDEEEDETVSILNGNDESEDDDSDATPSSSGDEYTSYATSYGEDSLDCSTDSTATAVSAISSMSALTVAPNVFDAAEQGLAELFWAQGKARRKSVKLTQRTSSRRRRKVHNTPKLPTIPEEPATDEPHIEKQEQPIEVLKKELAEASWNVMPTDLKLVHKLAEGGYSTVYYGHYRLSEVAVKVLRHGNTVKALQDFKRECDIMSALKSTNTVFFYGGTIGKNVASIVLEYCANGSLKDLMKGTGSWPWAFVLRVFHQIALGLRSLHTWVPAIVHRDIKSPNLMVDESYNVKIGDFGTAYFVGNRPETASDVVGTYAYVAPELYHADLHDEPACDIYSFSIVGWELVHRATKGRYAMPYVEERTMRQPFQILLLAAYHNVRPTIPSRTPEPIAALLRRCWDSFTGARPNAQELVEAISGLIETEKDKRRKWHSQLYRGGKGRPVNVF